MLKINALGVPQNHPLNSIDLEYYHDAAEVIRRSTHSFLKHSSSSYSFSRNLCCRRIESVLGARENGLLKVAALDVGRVIGLLSCWEVRMKSWEGVRAC